MTPFRKGFTDGVALATPPGIACLMFFTKERASVGWGVAFGIELACSLALAVAWFTRQRRVK